MKIVTITHFYNNKSIRIKINRVLLYSYMNDNFIIIFFMNSDLNSNNNNNNNNNILFL